MNPKFAAPSMVAGALPLPDTADTRQRAIDAFSRLPTAVVSLFSLISLLAFFFLVWNVPALGAEPAQALVLVARPSVIDPLYGKSILVVRQMPGDRHVGFILNKPTEIKLTEAFPGHEAPKSVTDPIYLGGPSNMNALFAMVHSQAAPEVGALVLTEHIHLAVSETAVGKAMTATSPERARFFVGAVVWKAGELAAEIKQGAWYVLDATPELVLPSRTTGLWSELVQRAEMAANGI